MISSLRTFLSRHNTPAVRENVTLALLWLVIINIFALLALNRFNVIPDSAYEWMSPDTFKPQQSWDIIDLHNRWDSYWFLDVAQKGYYLRGAGDQANVAFFPFYPLLIRMTALITGGNLVLAGWVVSITFLLLAVSVLTRLTEEFHRDIPPLFPVLFLLAYPMAFFLNTIYSESLFLFLSLSTVYAARRGNFVLAGCLTALASATRIAGVFLAVLLAVEFLGAHGWRALFSRRVLPLLVAPAGALAFFLYHWIAFGDFFLYLKVQSWWGRDFDMDSHYFVPDNREELVCLLSEIFCTAIAAGMACIATTRLRLSYGVYMLVTLSVALGSSGSTFGIPRYTMMLFPIYLLAGRMRSPVARSAWLFASGLLLSLHTFAFVNNYWAG